MSTTRIRATPPHQKLKRFLKENAISPVEFSRKLKVTSATVYFWLRAAKVPKREMARKIERATDGAVLHGEW